MTETLTHCPKCGSELTVVKDMDFDETLDGEPVDTSYLWCLRCQEKVYGDRKAN